MEAQEIIRYISEAKKKTPVKVFLKAKEAIPFENCQVFGIPEMLIVFGDWADISPVLTKYATAIEDVVIENSARNSAVPMLDLKEIKARIEPGAIIRNQVTIGDSAVVMMGAVINIGAVVGEGTMIDMGAILGGRATVGKNCHIGAGAVLAGVIEPPSATPVVVEDGVLVGANAVILEGVRIGAGAVVAAGAVVIDDVPAGAVVAGVPAKVIKSRADTNAEKINIVDALRAL
ncbi:MAG: 2,3,4,5-tetrahydropyridine-2,6-dicarboxylate N-acetyltransferase [Clostridiales Family XIII bacterium]|nr:2,3,4,5-tetrahydropyridine-2,6-dicarboxylate N-acetyltransferase [Clostridiales Family XIII bacterium]